MRITRKTTNQVINWIRHSKAVYNTDKDFMMLVDIAYNLREPEQTVQEWKDNFYYSMKYKEVC